MNIVFSIYHQYVARRIHYYKRLIKSWRLLENYRLVFDQSQQEKRPRFRFRDGYSWGLLDWTTGLHAFKEVFLREDYQLENSKEKKTIIDLGANIGLFTLYAHRKCPRARIFAIEAAPRAFQALSNNVTANQLSKKVTCLNYAVCSTDRTTTFYEVETSGWSSLYARRGALSGEPVTINTLSFSSLCNLCDIRRVDFLKVDIEGAEYDAILGDSEFFMIPISEMVIEVDRNPRDQAYTIDLLIDELEKHYRSVRLVVPGSPDYPMLHACKFIPPRR